MSVTYSANGTVTGTGSAINVEVGFIPTRVRIENVTDPGVFTWSNTMADDSMRKTIGDGTTTYPTSGGITPYAGAEGAASVGFTIGTDTDMNGASDVLHWIAEA